MNLMLIMSITFCVNNHFQNEVERGKVLLIIPQICLIVYSSRYVSHT